MTCAGDTAIPVPFGENGEWYSFGECVDEGVASEADPVLPTTERSSLGKMGGNEVEDADIVPGVMADAGVNSWD